MLSGSMIHFRLWLLNVLVFPHSVVDLRMFLTLWLMEVQVVKVNVMQIKIYWHTYATATQ